MQAKSMNGSGMVMFPNSNSTATGVVCSNTLATQVAVLTELNDQLRSEIKAMQHTIEEDEQQLDAAKTVLAAMKQAKEDAEAQVVTMTEKYVDVLVDLSIMKEEHSMAQAELGDVRAELGDVRAELGDVRAELGDVRAVLATVQADLAHEQEQHSWTAMQLSGWRSNRVVAPSVPYNSPRGDVSLSWDIVLAEVQSVPGMNAQLLAIIRLIAAHNGGRVVPEQAVVDAVSFWAYVEPSQALRAAGIMASVATGRKLNDVLRQAFAAGSC
jgi:hypothetical protein